jgi:hypothetical protein
MESVWRHFEFEHAARHLSDKITHKVLGGKDKGKGKGKGKDKVKGQLHLRTGHEGPEREYRYSSALSLTSTLHGVGGQHHAPVALPREREPVPIV